MGMNSVVNSMSPETGVTTGSGSSGVVGGGGGGGKAAAVLVTENSIENTRTRLNNGIKVFFTKFSFL